MCLVRENDHVGCHTQACCTGCADIAVHNQDILTALCKYDHVAFCFYVCFRRNVSICLFASLQYGNGTCGCYCTADIAADCGKCRNIQNVLCTDFHAAFLCLYSTADSCLCGSVQDRKVQGNTDRYGSASTCCTCDRIQSCFILCTNRYVSIRCSGFTAITNACISLVFYICTGEVAADQILIVCCKSTDGSVCFCDVLIALLCIDLLSISKIYCRLTTIRCFLTCLIRGIAASIGFCLVCIRIGRSCSDGKYKNTSVDTCSS